MRKIFQRRPSRLEPGFNLTPMLDMIFYLLFFFIMSTKMRDGTDRRMDVKLPSAKSPAAVPAEPVPALTLTAEGQLFFKNHEITREELDRELQSLTRKGQGEISIRGDKRVVYQRVVEVMDWCKLAGMKSVLLELGAPEAGIPAP